MNTLDVSNPKAIKRLKFKGLNKKRWENIELGISNQAFDSNESNDQQKEDTNRLFEEEEEEAAEFMPDITSARQSFDSTAKSWDSFVTLPPPEDDETLNSEWINIFIRCLKIFAYIITFILVLISAVLSKSLVLLMASMIREDHNITLCTESFKVLARGRSYSVIYNNSDPERIGWIWCLFFVLIAPIIITFYKCANICIFKKYKTPELITFLTVFIIETLNTIGLVLFVFMVLPAMESTDGAMISNSIGLVPAILVFVGRINNETKRSIKMIATDLLSIIIQIISMIAWTVIAYNDQIKHLWGIPIVLVFISLGYWENYLVIENSKHSHQVLPFLYKVKKDLTKSRYFTYAWISIWKIILISVTAFIYFYISEGKSLAYNLFDLFKESFSAHQIIISRDLSDQESHILTSKPSNMLWILFLQILFTLICYKSAKFACKICIQLFSFTFPLTIVGPFSLVLINTLCQLRIRDECGVTEFLPPLQYIFWFSKIDSHSSYVWTAFDSLKSIIWILSLFSQIWVTFHIWKPSTERLAKTENLFMKPSFCSVFIDQSLMLNRKIDSKTEISSGKKSNEKTELNDEEIVRIYLCATMWHENSDEMVQLLKSVIRMDSDQCARRQARKWFHVDTKHTDYYEIETHIFFDDALEDGKSGRVINRFVKQLIEIIDYAAGSVHECKIRLKTPTLTPTPYGGRLVWTLPGQNLLYVHLKDKTLIRHRKRWSQVMYMYYLLGYGLKDMDLQKRDKIAENTFILALDGDINFRPNAVRLLVDLMKKHKNLGAACGRIHPIGSGPMVWYQMFEYAISHWLQKATEHVFGCVLCSPGCFSLFRAKALMSENVMNKYSTKPSEAIHYIQYDQGEDRWLCTLLLQQGWRVEYCAASDAYTHCPEEFGEFYTQRRRWGPSTMANIMVLLTDYRHTVKVNENISTLYIVYQSALMIGTILSPGAIFLMVVGAMSTSFELSSQLCLLYSGAPILLYIIVCFMAKNETQISLSIILSTSYALIMLAVLVSTALEIIQLGLWQPTALFFISLCISFLIAAVIHPSEFVCLFPLVLYLLCIPSMYLLLTIYSIINLNVVTWGTREVALDTTAQQQSLTDKQPKNKNKILQFLNIKGFEGYNKSGFMSCNCCSNTNPNEDILTEMKSQLNECNRILQSFDTIVADKNNPNKALKHSLVVSQLSSALSDDNTVFEENEPKTIHLLAKPSSLYELDPNHSSSQSEFSFRSFTPIWTIDEDLKAFPTQDLDPQELEFWKDFIHLYLLPLDKDPKHEEKVASDLKELRNRFAFAFGILNSLFILFVLLLQMHKNDFNISFEFGEENITKIYNEDMMTYEVISQKSEKVQMDIIGLVLIVFFGTILLIQFVGMFLHRFNTLSHLLAFIDLNFCQRSDGLTNIQEVINENAVNYAKRLQKLNSIEENNLNQTHKYKSNRNVSYLSNNKFRPQFTNHENAFLKRCLSLKDNFEDEEILPESKLSRNKKSRSVSGSDVRKRLYYEVSQETIRRKHTLKQ